MQKFDYTLDFKTIDFRQHPELYRVGKGEQGVLLVEPYKSEILPYWRFKTPEIARQSADKIYDLFLEYKQQKDFVGMDMARKFLQMGYTRARRYANHKSGRKYAKDSKIILPNQEDPIKAESARIFHEVWQLAKTDPDYLMMLERHLLTTSPPNERSLPLSDDGMPAKAL
ncbi:DUF4385 domain-containing protein [Chamaesiphon sp. VAR_48_metabat_135_sub]|uniref:DUF4385 domain-containing protein n=1 Tax=Chamaesiphon sp. VAR_48_metabat_135_sub TaxID=2964699 RepID=UPI00286D1606|nr:DUF4385 domain-containing protein [Chamaesiphon sp. VAR_48_metabat_135_sub]